MARKVQKPIRADRVRELCDARRWTQERLAKEIGVTQPTAGRLLGKKPYSPQRDTVAGLVRVFGVSEAYLFGDSDDSGLRSLAPTVPDEASPEPHANEDEFTTRLERALFKRMDLSQFEGSDFDAAREAARNVPRFFSADKPDVADEHGLADAMLKAAKRLRLDRIEPKPEAIFARMYFGKQSAWKSAQQEQHAASVADEVEAAGRAVGINTPVVTRAKKSARKKKGRNVEA